MKEKPADSEIVFRDLQDAFDELMACRTSPVAVRRCLRAFVGLTQQLTEVFRKEFKERTGKNWIAGDFDGWNRTTVLFKKLRNSDYHNYPFLVYIRQRRYVPASKIDKSFPPHLELCLESETHLSDPFTREVKDTLTLHKHVSEEKDELVKWSDRENTFFLHARTKETRKALKSVDTDDVHELATRCHDVLKDYYIFYLNRLAVSSTNTTSEKETLRSK